MELINKTVLITGGARRVGAALTEKFARHGAKILLHCRNSRAEAEKLLATLPGSGHRLLSADFSRSGEAERLFAEAGRVDVLINNASLYFADELAVVDDARDRLQMQVNFFAPLALLRAFAAQSGLTEGAAVNLLDQEIFRPAARGGVYSLSRLPEGQGRES